MSQQIPNDDLFEGTKMTFGEHLDELRVVLFRALYGVAIAFIVGLALATHVIDFVKLPLEKALKNYYLKSAKETLKAEIGGELDQSVEAFIDENQYTYMDVYIERDQLRSLVEPFVQTSHSGRQQAQPTPVPTTANDNSVGNATTEDESSAESPPAESPPAESPPDKSPPADPGEDDPSARDANSDDPARDEPTTEGSSAEVDPRVDAASDNDAIGTDSPEIDPSTGDPTAATSNATAAAAHMVPARMWRPIETVVRSLSAQEAFMIWLKGGFVAGLVIASPWVFYQIWLFVAAGLYPHEKGYVYIYLPISLILFFSGAGMAFFFVFEPVLAFLFSFNRAMNIDPDPRISEWISFVLMLPLGFGIAFQLPLVMLFLNRIGVFSLEAYVVKWRIAILVIFIVSMFLTPADPISMLMLAGPLTLLYFLGIGLSKWMPSRKNPFDSAYEP